jgi:hypothetical protein
MAQTFKSCGQAALAATTLTDVYTVPAATSAVVQVIVANRGAATTVRVAHSVGGGAIADKDYLEYDTPIAANQSLVAVTGLGMQATDKLRVYGTSANVSANVNGVEIT